MEDGVVEAFEELPDLASAAAVAGAVEAVVEGVEGVVAGAKRRRPRKSWTPRWMLTL